MIDPPGQKAAVFATVKQAQPIARRIAQPRLAPSPALIRGLGVESDAPGLQPRDSCVEFIAFEIDHHRRFADLLYRMD